MFAACMLQWISVGGGDAVSVCWALNRFAGQLYP